MSKLASCFSEKSSSQELSTKVMNLLEESVKMNPTPQGRFKGLIDYFQFSHTSSFSVVEKTTNNNKIYIRGSFFHSTNEPRPYCETIYDVTGLNTQELNEQIGIISSLYIQ